MSVTTLLRKEKDGSLYKKSASAQPQEPEVALKVKKLVESTGQEAQGARRVLSNLLGLDVGGLGPKTIIPTLVHKAREESLPAKIAAEHCERHPEHYTQKQADSTQPMQRMFGEGAARGIDNYIMQDMALSGKPAVSKVKKGDAPSRDEAPSYITPGKETMPGTNRSMDQAMKAAGAVMARLVDQGDRLPTLPDDEKQDPMTVHRKVHEVYQHAGADTPVPGWNPDWRNR